jgi:hypothetical protein
MSMRPFRGHDDGVVLAGLKATPYGWPTASLDPGSRRRGPHPAEGQQHTNHKNQVSTVSGDCRSA